MREASIKYKLTAIVLLLRLRWFHAQQRWKRFTVTYAKLHEAYKCGPLLNNSADVDRIIQPSILTDDSKRKHQALAAVYTQPFFSSTDTMLAPKVLLRLASAIVGLMLFVVGCIGFNTLKSSAYTFESQTQFGCLCFLAVCFGLLLAFGESKLETFFFFFGFMRYRFGRACIFAVSGVMTALLGKTRNTQCNCDDNVILIIEGVALIAMAALQLLAIFVFGNNSAPKRSKDSNPSARIPAAVSLPITIPLPRETTTFQPVIQPVVLAPPPPQPPPVQPSPVPAHDNNLPSWMHTP